MTSICSVGGAGAAGDISSADWDGLLGVDRDTNWHGGGRWGLDAWWASVLSLDSGSLAAAVLLDGLELLGGVLDSVVVVVEVVDVVHVVVVDVGSLESLVALEVSLTTEEDVGLLLWVDEDWLADAAEVLVLSSKGEGVWGVGVA